MTAPDRTSKPTELLLAIDRAAAEPIGRQVENQLRDRIREGGLRPGTPLPSTRDLARQLGVSRGITVSAYAQLGAEGYLVLRQGARPRVSEVVTAPAPGTEPDSATERPRFDFRPSLPEVSTFPRRAWLRSVRAAIEAMSDSDLGYGDPRGVEALRTMLAEYLGRVRGVVAEPARTVITSGYTQAEGLVCRALAGSGAKRIALENPSDPEQRETAARAGLEVVPIGVDAEGLRVDELKRRNVDAVILGPAHQFPTGAVLSGLRRTELLAWLRDSEAMAIEDDYDAEYRYDRAPVGALQGLEPERVIYAGSASKTLAPTLRLGWLVLPAKLVDAVTREKHLADRGTARIEQFAYADFVGRGELDRHLRRMRTQYRARRDRLVEALAKALPETSVQGVAAGLHVTVALPAGDDERAIVAEAARRGIAVEAMGDYRAASKGDQPTLLIGYGQSPEPAIGPGVKALADAIKEARKRS